MSQAGESRRPGEDTVEAHYSEAVEAVRSYYNSNDVRRIYDASYGDEHLHLGIYENDRETVDEAGQRTVERIASMIHGLGPGTRVLDIGAGNGGSARYLFRAYGCHVACLNLSEVQNAHNRNLNARDRCSLAINVVDGSFEDLPVTDGSFDVVWSQDAILHSTRRRQVFAEVGRVLRKGGAVHLHRPHGGRTLPARSPAAHPRPRPPRLPGIPSGIPGDAVGTGVRGAGVRGPHAAPRHPLRTDTRRIARRRGGI